MPTCFEAIALLKHYKMPPFQNGKWLCSISSKMCEIRDSYRLMVSQWFHMIHSRVSAAASIVSLFYTTRCMSAGRNAKSDGNGDYQSLRRLKREFLNSV